MKGFQMKAVVEGMVVQSGVHANTKACKKELIAMLVAALDCLDIDALSLCDSVETFAK